MATSDKTQSAVLRAIADRRSIRRYTESPVPREIIEGILEAAIWSPSAHNRQPWRFCVIQDDSMKHQLASAMGARLRRDLQADAVPQAVIDADVNRSYDRITGAPVLIALCMTMADMDSYPDEKRATNEYMMAVQSVAMAGQNILLVAHEFGLGACWMCAPLFCPDVVVSALELPEDWQPQGLITLGYPAESKEKNRKPLVDSVIWR
ncbi:MAG: nitroreductase family protein [Aggregatilineales bacterium]